MSSALPAGDSPLNCLRSPDLLGWAVILIFTLLCQAPIRPLASQECNICQTHWCTPMASSTQEAEARKTLPWELEASLGYIARHVI